MPSFVVDITVEKTTVCPRLHQEKKPPLTILYEGYATHANLRPQRRVGDPSASMLFTSVPLDSEILR